MATKDSWRDDWQLAFPSRYIGAQHLHGRDVTLTISRVELELLEMFRQGKTEKKRKLILFFKELEGRGEDEPSMLLMNKTNSRTVAGLFGKSVDAWVGKAVTLFATEVEAFGKSQEAVRIRSKVPSAKTRQQQTSAASPAPGDAPSAPTSAAGRPGDEEGL